MLPAQALLVIASVASIAVQGGQLRDDAHGLWQPERATPLAVGAVAAVTASATRDDWHGQLRGRWYIDRPADVTDVYGAGSVHLPAAVGLWAGGSTLGHDGARGLGRGLTRSLLLAHGVVVPIKLAVGRRRPDGSDRRSFPSGHTASAFAAARYVHGRHGGHASLPLYGLAVVTGLGRIEGNRHYLSDVLAGAALGVVVGGAVADEDGWDERLDVASRPGGAELRVRF